MTPSRGRPEGHFASVRGKRMLMIWGVLLSAAPALGCGIDWTLPSNHFDGVDERGHVSYWEKIGEAELGNGLTIPVHIGFNSHRETSSPVLGKGWIVPLLESHVEPIDDNNVKVIMPDGWNFYFSRNSTTETWRGNAGWLGETNGARFTISAPCGWRIKFDGGKIQEIETRGGHTISIKYNGTAATEADIDNKPFVQVGGGAGSVPTEILIAGRKIGLLQGQRPRVQVVSGNALLTGFDNSLTQLEWADGRKESFDFTVAQDLIPTLSISNGNQGPRTLKWNPSSQQIQTDGAWTYEFPKDAKDIAMSRKNPQGEVESWVYDSNLGSEITVTHDGLKRERKWFTGGPLKGLTREIVDYDAAGHVAADNKTSRDEKGSIVRQLTSAKAFGTTEERQFDASHRPVLVRLPGGLLQTFKYDPDSTTETDFQADGLTVTRQVFTDGREIIKYSDKRYLELDGQKRPLVQITAGGETLKYLYDDALHMARIIKDGQLVTIIRYNANSEEIGREFINSQGQPIYRKGDI